MAIKMRRGNYQDFNPNKLLPGEWAVSLDEKYVHMCFAPGVVSRMATYDAFEEDMKQIQIILSTCQDIKTAVEAFCNLAEQHSGEAESYSVQSKSWAIGGTGNREGEDTNNSKYFSNQSKTHADRAETEADRSKAEADRASYIVGIGIATDTKAGIIKGNTDEFSVAADGKLSLSSAFDEQQNLTNITGTENKKVMFGKIAKSIKDLINHIGDKTRHFTLTNNLLATVAGTALDATMGKALDDKVTEVNRKLKLENSIALESSYTSLVIAQKVGNISTIRIGRNTNPLAVSSYLVCVLPESYRPSNSFGKMVCIGSTQPISVYFSILSTGEVSIRTFTNVPANTFAFIYETYICI